MVCDSTPQLLPGGDGWRYEIPEEETCSVAVVSAVADVVDCPPFSLPTLLSEVVDPDALDRVVAAADGEDAAAAPATPLVEFTYCGCTVRVADGRHVVVREE